MRNGKMTDRRDFIAKAGIAAAGLAVATVSSGARAATAAAVLKRYVTEREAPGVGAATAEEVAGMAANSCAALVQFAPNLQWEQSYRTADKFFCVYLSVDEETIRNHGKVAGIPVNKITLVTSIVDPTLAAA
jgi:hypothetical protein